MKKPDYSLLRFVDVLAFWKILFQVFRTPGEPIDGVLRSVRNDYSLGGRLPVKNGFDICIDTGVLRIDSDSGLTIVDSGRSFVSTYSTAEPSRQELRAIVYIILTKNKLPWIVFCTEDQATFRTAVPDNWQQILDNCGLLEMDDAGVLRWWKGIFYKYSIAKQIELKLLSDVAEKLTYQLEIRRIQNDGVSSSSKVSWSASVDDSLGYDILSIRGTYHKNDASTPIYIEVKSSGKKNAKSFIMYITRNEWEVALKNLDNYYFYCWIGVRSNGSFHSGPYLISAKDILGCVPLDQTSQIEWSECRMTVDLTLHAIVSV